MSYYGMKMGDYAQHAASLSVSKGWSPDLSTPCLVTHYMPTCNSEKECFLLGYWASMVKNYERTKACVL